MFRSESLFLLARRRRERALDLEERSDVSKRHAGTFWAGAESLEIVPSCVRPTVHFCDRALSIEVIVDGVSVSNQVAGVAGKQVIHCVAVMVLAELEKH